MKQTTTILSCALALAFAIPVSNLLAAEPPKAPPAAKANALSPAEINKLRNENAAKGRQLLDQLRKAVRAPQTNDLAKLRPLIDQYVALGAIPPEKGRPVNFSPYVMHKQLAETLSSPLNLRYLPAIRKELDEAVRTAQTPAEKAEALYAKALFAIKSAEDDHPEKHEKILLDTYTNKDLSVRRRLDLMCAAIENGPLRDLDFEKIGSEIMKEDPKSHSDYYYTALRIVNGKNWRGVDVLGEDASPEHVVELCDKALADPDVISKNHYVVTKSRALVQMRQTKAAEQFLLEQCATTNASLRHDNCMLLGDFYEKAAVRYYDDPDQATLQKALTAYSNAFLAKPWSTRPLYQAAKVSLAMNDPDGAIRSYETIIPLEKGKTNTWTAIGLGDAYYAKKDWSKATTYYAMALKNLSPDSMLNYCRALFIQKRYPETLEALKSYEKKARGSAAKDEARYFQKHVERLIAPATK